MPSAAKLPDGFPDAAAEGGIRDTGIDSTLDGPIESAGNGLDDPFDVIVQYADRPLPDVELPPDGGASATGDGGGANAGVDSSAWPQCAPDIPHLGIEFAAVFIGDGGQAAAPDGSVCASQVWVENNLCDRCLRTQTGYTASWLGAAGPVELPPCSDLAGAGVAAVGPGAGRPRMDLCRELFACIATTYCFATGNNVEGCLCKGVDTTHCSMTGGDGVCFVQEQAAMEIPNGPPGAVFSQMAVNLTAIAQSYNDPGHAATSLNTMFNDAIILCRPQCLKGFDAGSN